MPFRVSLTEATLLTGLLGRPLSSLLNFMSILHLFGISSLEDLGSNVRIKASCATVLSTASRVSGFSSATLTAWRLGWKLIWADTAYEAPNSWFFWLCSLWIYNWWIQASRQIGFPMHKWYIIIKNNTNYSSLSELSNYAIYVNFISVLNM